MSMGQVAIKELRKRVGKVDPVTGFQILDDMMKTRDGNLDMFEQLVCGMAWHQGQVAGCFERRDIAGMETLHGLDTSWLSPSEDAGIFVPGVP